MLHDALRSSALIPLEVVQMEFWPGGTDGLRPLGSQGERIGGGKPAQPPPTASTDTEPHRGRSVSGISADLAGDKGRYRLVRNACELLLLLVQPGHPFLPAVPPSWGL
eukprot:4444111-Alexandrium_andersonii.AAC.1